MEKEIRYYNQPDLLTEEREGKKVDLIRGTAVKFGELSRNLGWFREKFDRDAFSDVMDNDVVALFNHNMDLILARTISKTLRIYTDDEGLKYEFEAPDTSAGRDLVVNMKAGNVQHSSFSFQIRDDKWEEDEEDGEIRTVLKVKRLFDVSPVVFPAYPQSTSEVAKRSYQHYIEKKNSKNLVSDIEYLEHEIILFT
jgi:HK97 family phage prohead protease